MAAAARGCEPVGSELTHDQSILPRAQSLKGFQLTTSADSRFDLLTDKPDRAVTKHKLSAAFVSA